MWDGPHPQRRPDEHDDKGGFPLIRRDGCSKCTPKKLKGYRSDILDAYECDEPIDGD